MDVKFNERMADEAIAKQKGEGLLGPAACYAHERPRIVCLCGSTRFMGAFQSANLRETLDGKIVLSIGCNTKSDSDLIAAGALTEELKQRLDRLHLRKIDISDEVLVINVGGYIGESTAREIVYAAQHKKRIRLLEPTLPEEIRKLLNSLVADTGHNAPHEPRRE